jgi:hypothetical protein
LQQIYCCLQLWSRILHPQKTLLKQTSILSDFIYFSLFLCNQHRAREGERGERGPQLGSPQERERDDGG